MGTRLLRESSVTTITRRLGTSPGGDTQEEGGKSFLGVSVLGAMRPAARNHQNRAAYLAINGKDLKPTCEQLALSAFPLSFPVPFPRLWLVYF